MHGQFCIQNIPNCIIEHKKQGTVEENGKEQKE